MVSVIKTGHSIHRIFNYNENKVKQGAAKFIGAGNYPVDHDKMSISMKLNRLLKQVELNENVTRNSVHISLNFHASEINLPVEKLQEIAEVYMERIGFGKQPFLIYQHFDAAHPHIHIVSVKVRPDGSRIDMNNIGRNQSEIARQSIEKEFGLISAEAQKSQEKEHLKPVSPSKALYGKSTTKMAIQNVLEAVLNQYRFTTLPELNAILKQYNVMADRGSENSRIFEVGGLLYRILDEHGQPVGVPIKASDFYNKPTLKFLDERFAKNDITRVPFKARVKNAVDTILMGKAVTLEELIKALDKKGIYVALRKNEAGLLYGITYVDHQTKCVFNGSALGKLYSAKAIQERCHKSDTSEHNLPSHSVQQQTGLQSKAGALLTETKALSSDPAPDQTLSTNVLLEALLEPEHAAEYVSGQFKKGRKRKKRRNNPNSNQ